MHGRDSEKHVNSRIGRGMSTTNTYPRTIAIDHIMVTLQFIVMLSKVVIRLRGSQVAIMSHGVAKIEDLRDEVWCCSCPID